MLIHQDGSTHEWVANQVWDLIVTMDDATGEHYSMFFVEEEGTASSFRGVRETIESHGLFASLYTDRGSHYWLTPAAGGKVDMSQPTQFGRANRAKYLSCVANILAATNIECLYKAVRKIETLCDVRDLTKYLAIP